MLSQNDEVYNIRRIKVTNKSYEEGYTVGVGVSINVYSDDKYFHMHGIFCKKCGNYIECRNGKRSVYCSCDFDYYGNKIFLETKGKLSRLYDELEMRITDRIVDPDPPVPFNFNVAPRLLPSSYGHNGPCDPDRRTCGKCWRYWCGSCGGGVGGMMGSGKYKRCPEKIKKAVPLLV